MQLDELLEQIDTLRLLQQYQYPAYRCTCIAKVECQACIKWHKLHSTRPQTKGPYLTTEERLANALTKLQDTNLTDKQKKGITHYMHKLQRQLYQRLQDTI